MKTIDDIGKEWSSYNPPSDDGILRIIQNWGNELISNFRSNLQKNKSHNVNPGPQKPPLQHPGDNDGG